MKYVVSGSVEVNFVCCVDAKNEVEAEELAKAAAEDGDITINGIANDPEINVVRIVTDQKED